MNRYLCVALLIIVTVYIYMKFIHNNPTNAVNLVRRQFGLINKRSCPATYKVSTIYNKNHNAKGVISSCLFGNLSDTKVQNRYIAPLLESIRIAPYHIPEWVYRVYTDPRCPPHIVQQLIDAGAEIYMMNQPSVGTEGSMWRFLPASESLPFISVDSDEPVFMHAPYGMKWTEYIDEWLESDDTFFMHILYVLPIQAKFWGGKPGCIPEINKLINEYCASWYGNDEAFLTKIVLPMFREHGAYRPVTMVFNYIVCVVLLTTAIVCIPFLYQT